MKFKKRSLGIKHRTREQKKRKYLVALAVAVLFILIPASGFYINSIMNQPPTNQRATSDSQPKAVIVDQLSLTYPNQTFIETATNTLTQAGYRADYYAGENVTVQFYRNLSAHGYKLIILRVHSTATEAQTGKEAPVLLFTSESISQTKYVYEQLTSQLWSVSFSNEERERGITYFGISPAFLTQSMVGRFENTMIIMMGCEGLRNFSMAKAFIEKGAIAYVSWNGSVLASHTDQTTTHLLQHLLTEKRSLHESVRETFKELGADPAYNSLLSYYPLEAGGYTIRSVSDNLTTSAIIIQSKVFPGKKKDADIHALA